MRYDLGAAAGARLSTSVGPRPSPGGGRPHPVVVVPIRAGDPCPDCTQPLQRRPGGILVCAGPACVFEADEDADRDVEITEALDGQPGGARRRRMPRDPEDWDISAILGDC